MHVWKLRLSGSIHYTSYSKLVLFIQPCDVRFIFADVDIFVCEFLPLYNVPLGFNYSALILSFWDGHSHSIFCTLTLCSYIYTSYLFCVCLHFFGAGQVGTGRKWSCTFLREEYLSKSFRIFLYRRSVPSSCWFIQSFIFICVDHGYVFYTLGYNSVLVFCDSICSSLGHWEVFQACSCVP